MKRQIFWLIFSCLTATNFLSYSMEKQEESGNAANPAGIYPELSEDNTTVLEESEEAANNHQEIVTINEQESQGIIEYLCDDLQLISRLKLEKFLGSQAAGLISLVIRGGDLEEFFQEAFTELYEKINKKKAAELIAQLQEKYVPDIANEYIDDVRWGLIGILILEKAVTYAEKASENAENEETLWNDEWTKGIIGWASEKLNQLFYYLARQYEDEFPLKDEEQDDEASTNKEASKKLVAIKNSDESEETMFKGIRPELASIIKKNIISLKKRIKALERELIQKDRQLKKAQSAQPASNEMRILQGTLLGVGGTYIVTQLFQILCNIGPVCVDLSPESSVASFICAVLGIGATTGSLYYLDGAKNLRVLLTKLVTKANSTAITTGFTIHEYYKRIKTEPKKKPKKEAKTDLNPWQAFDKSITSEKQKNMIDANVAEIFAGIFQGDVDAIEEFLEFYIEYNKYLIALKNEKQTEEQTSKFRNFRRFKQSLNEDQKKLFEKGITYLRNLNDGEKEDY